MGVEDSASAEVKAPLAEESPGTEHCIPAINPRGNPVESDDGESAAAVRVQKLYRGYRTRRHMADCAVMTRKYAWWNVLEGALLRHNSEQFYAYNKPETATTRWVRLKTKAAKLGRGLSKDEKARKLALQHWLEAIDARHRYGHNLNFYYDVWLNSQTPEPFFYWLDVGEGREVDLKECPRKKLQKDQIKYLGPKERKQYEVIVEDGKLVYKQTGEFVHTPKGDKWIFVMSTSGKLYVAQKAKGKFQHSSFLAGSATTAAGRLLVNKGVLELMEAHSGHYHPTEENFNMLVNILTRDGADLTMAKVQGVSDDMLPSHLYSQQSFLKETEDVKSAEALDRFVQGDKVLVAAEDGKAVTQMEDVVSNKLSETQLADSDKFAAKEAANLDIIHNKDNLEGVSIKVMSTKGCNDDPSPKGNEVRIWDEFSEKSLRDEALSEIHVAKEAVAPEKNETSSDIPITTVQMGVKKLPSFSWSSGVGARLSTLSELPVNVRSKAVEFLRQPSQRLQFTAAN